AKASVIKVDFSFNSKLLLPSYTSSVSGISSSLTGSSASFEQPIKRTLIKDKLAIFNFVLIFNLLTNYGTFYGLQDFLALPRLHNVNVRLLCKFLLYLLALLHRP